MNKKNWEEFQNTGLLWFINTILHLFGWAIVLVKENDKIVECYPTRVKYRGFDEKSNTEGYIKVSNYLKSNINDITEEAKG